MEQSTALIIDDDIEIANLLGAVLNLIGYEYEIARSAKDALSSLAISTPHLVLLDMRLDSALSGEDIVYQIRANPRLRDTRVIVITGHPSRAEQIAPLVDFTLLKPIDTEQLKSIIADLTSSEPAPKRDYFCDPVTGIYNIDFFYSRLEHAIERAKRRPDFIFGICGILVRLRQPSGSDQVEPVVFNEILRDATQSLIQNLRPTDTVARLSHFNLATLHEELREPDDIKVIVRRIQTILTPPFNVEGQIYTLAFKIGTATSNDNYKEAKDLLELAEKNIVVD